MKAPDTLRRLYIEDLLPSGTDVLPEMRTALTPVLEQLLLGYNRLADAFTQLHQNNHSFLDNFSGQYVEADFSHGVEQTIGLKIAAARGCILLGCSGGYYAAAFPRLRALSKSSPSVGVTMYFNDPGAMRVRCGLILLPEGPGISLPAVADPSSTSTPSGAVVGTQLALAAMTGTVDGVNRSFTTPAFHTLYAAILGGSLLSVANGDFTVSGTTVTFTNAPTATPYALYS